MKTADSPEGVKLPADMFVVASGCRYNLNPPFLHELGIGARWGPAALHCWSPLGVAAPHSAAGPARQAALEIAAAHLAGATCLMACPCRRGRCRV